MLVSLLSQEKKKNKKQKPDPNGDEVTGLLKSLWCSGDTCQIFWLLVAGSFSPVPTAHYHCQEGCPGASCVELLSSKVFSGSPLLLQIKSILWDLTLIWQIFVEFNYMDIFLNWFNLSRESEIYCFMNRKGEQFFQWLIWVQNSWWLFNESDWKIFNES